MTDDVKPLLEVRDLTVTFDGGDRSVRAVDHVTFEAARGESIALVGASGSGKTTLALAIPRLLPNEPACTLTGSILLDGRALSTEAELRAARGRDIGVVYQDPMSALDPLMRVGDQVAEALSAHASIAPDVALAQAVRWLARVGLPGPERVARAWPFELSGGMRQRVVIAMAIACRPSLLILDEPTTSLDSLTQAHVLELLDELRAEFAFAMILVTHDLALARGRCDRAIRMSAGRIVDDGPVDSILHAVASARTRSESGRAAATRAAPEPRPTHAAPLLVVRDLAVEYPGRRGFLRSEAGRRVLDGVSFDLNGGEMLAVVGGSGAGKTTLLRGLLRLVEPCAGTVTLRREPRETPRDLLALDRSAMRRVRPDLGVVFQDPSASLDPRRSVRESLHEALSVRDRTGRVLDDEARVWLEAVGLRADHLDRLPHQISGGERQRVCIARALATSPRLLVLDEALSSLDGPVRDEILDLLERLRIERALACILITHDLDTVERFAERIAVLDAGRIVESGPTARVFAEPQAEATRALLAARL